MQDRRNDNRSFCADLVEVVWSEGGRTRHKVANLEDISPSGICLMLDCPLLSGIEISVRCGESELVGVVRHSTSHPAGFLLGVEFHADSQWSLKNYNPRHLFDPQDMFSVAFGNRKER